MKKRVLSYIISTFMAANLIVAMQMSAHAAIDWVLDEDGTLTISGSGEIQYSGEWSDVRDSIKSVVIEDGIVSIGAGSFSNCKNLTSVTMAGSVETIENYAFEECDALESIIIPEGVKYLGRAFYYCDNLKNISIPASVETMDIGGAWAYPPLANISVAEENQYYSSIDGNLFNKDATVLLKYAVGKEDTSYTIPDGVKVIGTTAFYKSENLESLTIPGSVETIEQTAFYGSTALKAVEIPSGTTTIEWGAFKNCPVLENVSLSETVSELGNDVFDICNALSVISVDENNPYYCSIDGNLFDKDDSILIQYATGKTDTEYTVPEGTKGIGRGAFGYSSLQTVSFPDSVEFFNYMAFAYCKNLKHITMPDSVTFLEDAIFFECDALESVTLPENITSIGSSVFKNCYNLKTADIPKNVTSIGEYAFAGCSVLEGIEIPAGVTEIGEQAFCGCENLKNITIPNGMSTINAAVFAGCSGLKSVIIPDTITSIGNSAFSGCSGLTEIHIPPIVKEIGAHAFSECTGIKEVAIPSAIENIGNDAFWGCTSLTDVTVSRNTDNYNINSRLVIRPPVIPREGTIGEQAFAYCTALKNVAIPENVTHIEQWAFAQCDALEKITLPDTVAVINRGAFDECTKLSDVYYGGNEEEWDDIRISVSNDYLKNADIHYNSITAQITDLTAVDSYLINVSAEVKNTSKAVLYIAIFDENGEFVRAVPNKIDPYIGIFSTYAEVPEGGVVKAMLWKDMMPLDYKEF